MNAAFDLTPDQRPQSGFIEPKVGCERRHQKSIDTFDHRPDPPCDGKRPSNLSLG
jgi:hypothetical protein